MEKSFSFIDLNSNDEINKLNGEELRKFIEEIDNYYLELRKLININKNDTFGMEIEFERIKNEDEFRTNFFNLSNMYGTYINESKWNITTDSSLEKGIEIRSPILVDCEKTWKALEMFCNLASIYGEIYINAAAHVHLGTDILGYNKTSWYNLLRLWYTYENVIYRFAYGEYLNKLPGIKHCFALAPKIKELEDNYYNCIEHFNLPNFLHYFSDNRATAINFKNAAECLLNKRKDKNTIEFRCPNGTMNPIIWQNNVNLFDRILNYCKSDKFNDDIVEKRMKNKFIAKQEFYHEIFLEQALELCDLLFDKNLDKVYFLKQYLKQFEVSKYAKLSSNSLTKKNNSLY